MSAELGQPTRTRASASPRRGPGRRGVFGVVTVLAVVGAGVGFDRDWLDVRGRLDSFNACVALLPRVRPNVRSDVSLPLERRHLLGWRSSFSGTDGVYFWIWRTPIDDDVYLQATCQVVGDASGGWSLQSHMQFAVNGAGEKVGPSFVDICDQQPERCSSGGPLPRFPGTPQAPW